MITLKGVTLRRGTKVLLEGATVSLNPSEKIGLVGRNGAGKSSLFALLAGGLHEDAGEFQIPPTWRMAQVAQEMPETGETATDFVVAGDTRLMAAQAEVHAAEAAGDGERMGHAYAALHDAGAHDAQARAQALILGLGFQVDELCRPVNSFSGGWRMRLQLARALMCPSDLLLLDEPTNHLDLATREALAVALNEFEGTLMLVSHDRALLRSVCDEFWLVARGGVAPFDGDLEDYQRYLLDEAKRLRAAAADQVAADSIAVAAIPESAAAQKPLQEPLNPVNPAEQRRLDAQRRQQLAEKTRPLKRALEKTEQRMQALGAEQATIEQRLATALPPADIAEAGRRLKAVGDELATLEDEWLRLSGEIEAIE